MTRPLHEPDDISPAERGDLSAFLQHMVKVGASDLFLSVGALPTIKVEGRMVAVGAEPLRPGSVRGMAYSVMTESQIRQFEMTLECDLAVSVSGLGRFRFNVFLQRSEVSVVARLVKYDVPRLESLNLPPVVAKLALLRQGLVLVVATKGRILALTLVRRSMPWRMPLFRASLKALARLVMQSFSAMRAVTGLEFMDT